MDADEHAVLRDREVLLDEVRALLDRQPVCLQGVLWRVGGSATVCNDRLLHARPVTGVQRRLAECDTHHEKQASGRTEHGIGLGPFVDVTATRWQPSGIARTAAIITTPCTGHSTRFGRQPRYPMRRPIDLPQHRRRAFAGIVSAMRLQPREE